jgi:hypothetical protein
MATTGGQGILDPMSTCPACGVAVVPGYVRCPKCKAALPQVRFRGGGGAVGGTSAAPDTSKFPVIPVLIAIVVGGGIMAYFGLRGGGKKTAVAAPQATPAEPVAGATVTGPAQPSSRGTFDTTAPSGPNPTAVAASLEKSLQRKRLWSNVEVRGSRVDVRSGSCDDPGMSPTLDGAAADLKAAGLTKLRCLEQSGRVVIERDL